MYDFFTSPAVAMIMGPLSGLLLIGYVGVYGYFSYKIQKSRKEDLKARSHFESTLSESELEIERLREENDFLWNELKKRVQNENSSGPEEKEEEITPSAARIILNIPNDARLNKSSLNKARKRALMRVHPDHGGSDDAMIRVNSAYKCLLSVV